MDSTIVIRTDHETRVQTHLRKRKVSTFDSEEQPLTEAHGDQVASRPRKRMRLCENVVRFETRPVFSLPGYSTPTKATQPTILPFKKWSSFADSSASLARPPGYSTSTKAAQSPSLLSKQWPSFADSCASLARPPRYSTPTKVAQSPILLSKEWPSFAESSAIKNRQRTSRRARVKMKMGRPVGKLGSHRRNTSAVLSRFGKTGKRFFVRSDTPLSIKTLVFGYFEPALSTVCEEGLDALLDALSLSPGYETKFQ